MAPFKPTLLAAALLAAGIAHAQNSTALKPVTVTGTVSPPAADITPFADVPLKEVPASVSIITSRQIDAVGARRLADLTQFDPSVSDAYNAPGYWDFLAIRGFTLDNRFNYRREGLPINAETTIPLDNKERIEILKGTSGIQAGTSAPGGLVNFVVKRPTESDLRAVKLEWTQRSTLLAAADLGGRFGRDNAFGYRINVAEERLRPQTRNLDGSRSLLAFAGDWRVSGDSLLEGEFEWSRKEQPSQVGSSLLGPVLPAVPDPRQNLNNQPWAQPSKFDALTGTLRFTQSINRDWRWSAQLGTQQLKTDDFTAFPFGCSAEGNYDRFCSDGTFDYYDFRSQDERRKQDAASLTLKGRFATGAVSHDLSVGVMAGRVRNRFNLQAFNWVGVGSIDGTTVVPSDPSLTFFVPNVDERSLEVSASDAIHWTPNLSTWIGLRHTHLDRGYTQDLTTPWLAVSYKFADVVAYASWGEGMESKRVTSDPLYALANAGLVLPAAKSRQLELGVKGGDARFGWEVALFQISRPLTNFDYCVRTFLCTIGEYDGRAVHRGVEASVQWNDGPWRIDGSAMLLDAKREGSVYESANNGQHPPNVPNSVLRATAAYRVPSIAGLEVEGHVSHEGRRSVLADGTITLPAWTRVDAALRYETKLSNVDTAWTVGVTNLFDRRYWKEAPYQFGHVYLYPGAARTFRVSFTAAL